ncbi:hypothetical protein N0824_02219 [Microcystis sp. 0824]|nr:hypothetical protein N0824_02219 [Microcystis sp. 0824]
MGITIYGRIIGSILSKKNHPIELTLSFAIEIAVTTSPPSL